MSSDGMIHMVIQGLRLIGIYISKAGNRERLVNYNQIVFFFLSHPRSNTQNSVFIKIIIFVIYVYSVCDICIYS